MEYVIKKLLEFCETRTQTLNLFRKICQGLNIEALSRGTAQVKGQGTSVGFQEACDP